MTARLDTATLELDHHLLTGARIIRTTSSGPDRVTVWLDAPIIRDGELVRLRRRGLLVEWRPDPEAAADQVWVLGGDGVWRFVGMDVIGPRCFWPPCEARRLTDRTTCADHAAVV